MACDYEPIHWITSVENPRARLLRVIPGTARANRHSATGTHKQVLVMRIKVEAEKIRPITRSSTLQRGLEHLESSPSTSGWISSSTRTTTAKVEACVRAPNPWFPPIQELYVVVFVDGACSYNGRDEPRPGTGVWFGPDDPLNVSRTARGRRPITLPKSKPLSKPLKELRMLESRKQELTLTPHI